MQFKEIIPFAYHAPQSMLDDLKQRLAQVRWPERETTNDWSEGVPLRSCALSSITGAPITTGGAARRI